MITSNYPLLWNETIKRYISDSFSPDRDHLQERYGIPHCRQIDCLFNRMFKLQQRKHQSSALPSLCEGKPLVTDGSMSWRHHVVFPHTCAAQSNPTPSFSNKAKTLTSGLHFTAEKLTLYVLNFSEGTKDIFTFCVISPHWYDEGSWNPSSNKTRTYLFYIVNIMAADVLAT